MSTGIIHPSSMEGFPFPESATSNSFASFPTVALTPGFLSLPSLANDTWPPSSSLPTPPPLPSWAIKPDPDEQPLCIDPALQPDHSPSHTPSTRKASSPDALPDTKQRQKRELFLARNRLAASKCRQKKRQHNKELESRYEEVARKKKMLQLEADQLRSQVLQLKDELLRHSQCNDDSIKGHLAQMVNEVTRKSPTFVDINSLLTTSSPSQGSSSGSSSVTALPTADSPLLQELMERERRQSERWGLAGEIRGPVPRREDTFEDLINFG